MGAALIVQFEVLQCGERVLIAIDPVLLGFIRASAVALIEVGAAGGADTQAIRAAQHHKGRIHNDGIVDGAGKIDLTVLPHQLESILVGFLVLRLFEKVVLLDLAGNVEARGLQAAVAGRLRMRADGAFFWPNGKSGRQYSQVGGFEYVRAAFPLAPGETRQVELVCADE